MTLDTWMIVEDEWVLLPVYRVRTVRFTVMKSARTRQRKLSARCPMSLDCECQMHVLPVLNCNVDLRPEGLQALVIRSSD